MKTTYVQSLLKPFQIFKRCTPKDEANEPASGSPLKSVVQSWTDHDGLESDGSAVAALQEVLDYCNERSQFLAKRHIEDNSMITLGRFKEAVAFGDRIRYRLEKASAAANKEIRVDRHG